MGTDLRTKVTRKNFVHAYVFFPADTVLIFVLFVHAYMVYHNLASGSQQICILRQKKKKQNCSVTDDNQSMAKGNDCWVHYV